MAQERGFVCPTDDDGNFDISQLTFASFSFLVWKEIHYGDASAKESAIGIANDLISCACELLALHVAGDEAAMSVDADTGEVHDARDDFGFTLYDGLSKRLSSWLSRTDLSFYVRDLECFVCCDDAVTCYDVSSYTIRDFFCVDRNVQREFGYTTSWCLDKIDMHDHVLGQELSDVVDESWVFQLEEFSYLYKALHDGVRAVCIQIGYLDGGSFCLGIDEAIEFAKRDDVQFCVVRGVIGEPLYRELAVDCKVFHLVDDSCAYMVVLDCSGYDVSENVVRSFSKSCGKKAIVSLALPTMMLPVRCPESHCGALVYKPVRMYGDEVPEEFDSWVLGHNCFYHETDDRLLSLIYQGKATDGMIEAYEYYCDLCALEQILVLFRHRITGLTSYDDYMRVVRKDADWLASAFTYGMHSGVDNKFSFSWDEFDVLFLHMIAVDGFAPSGYDNWTFLYSVARLYSNAFHNGEFPNGHGQFNGYDTEQLHALIDAVCSGLLEYGMDLKIRALQDGVPYEDVIA